MAQWRVFDDFVHKPEDRMLSLLPFFPSLLSPRLTFSFYHLELPYISSNKHCVLWKQRERGGREVEGDEPKRLPFPSLFPLTSIVSAFTPLSLALFLQASCFFSLLSLSPHTDLCYDVTELKRNRKCDGLFVSCFVFFGSGLGFSFGRKRRSEKK